MKDNGGYPLQASKEKKNTNPGKEKEDGGNPLQASEEKKNTSPGKDEGDRDDNNIEINIDDIKEINEMQTDGEKNEMDGKTRAAKKDSVPDSFVISTPPVQIHDIFTPSLSEADKEVPSIASKDHPEDENQTLSHDAFPYQDQPEDDKQISSEKGSNENKEIPFQEDDDKEVSANTEVDIKEGNKVHDCIMGNVIVDGLVENIIGSGVVSYLKTKDNDEKNGQNTYNSVADDNVADDARNCDDSAVDENPVTGPVWQNTYDNPLNCDDERNTDDDCPLNRDDGEDTNVNLVNLGLAGDFNMSENLNLFDVPLGKPLGKVNLGNPNASTEPRGANNASTGPLRGGKSFDTKSRLSDTRRMFGSVGRIGDDIHMPDSCIPALNGTPKGVKGFKGSPVNNFGMPPFSDRDDHILGYAGLDGNGFGSGMIGSTSSEVRGDMSRNPHNPDNVGDINVGDIIEDFAEDSDCSNMIIDPDNPTSVGLYSKKGKNAAEKLNQISTKKTDQIGKKKVRIEKTTIGAEKLERVYTLQNVDWKRIHDIMDLPAWVQQQIDAHNAKREKYQEGLIQQAISDYKAKLAAKKRELVDHQAQKRREREGMPAKHQDGSGLKSKSLNENDQGEKANTDTHDKKTANTDTEEDENLYVDDLVQKNADDLSAEDLLALYKKQNEANLRKHFAGLQDDDDSSREDVAQKKEADARRAERQRKLNQHRCHQYEKKAPAKTDKRETEPDRRETESDKRETESEKTECSKHENDESQDGQESEIEPLRIRDGLQSESRFVKKYGGFYSRFQTTVDKYEMDIQRQLRNLHRYSLIPSTESSSITTIKNRLVDFQKKQIKKTLRIVPYIGWSSRPGERRPPGVPQPGESVHGVVPGSIKPPTVPAESKPGTVKNPKSTISTSNPMWKLSQRVTLHVARLAREASNAFTKNVLDWKRERKALEVERKAMLARNGKITNRQGYDVPETYEKMDETDEEIDESKLEEDLKEFESYLFTCFFESLWEMDGLRNVVDHFVIMNCKNPSQEDTPDPFTETEVENSDNDNQETPLDATNPSTTYEASENEIEEQNLEKEGIRRQKRQHMGRPGGSLNYTGSVGRQQEQTSTKNGQRRLGGGRKTATRTGDSSKTETSKFKTESARDKALKRIAQRTSGGNSPLRVSPTRGGGVEAGVVQGGGSSPQRPAALLFFDDTHCGRGNTKSPVSRNSNFPKFDLEFSNSNLDSYSKQRAAEKARQSLGKGYLHSGSLKNNDVGALKYAEERRLDIARGIIQSLEEDPESVELTREWLYPSRDSRGRDLFNYVMCLSLSAYTTDHDEAFHIDVSQVEAKEEEKAKTEDAEDEKDCGQDTVSQMAQLSLKSTKGKKSRGTNKHQIKPQRLVHRQWIVQQMLNLGLYEATAEFIVKLFYEIREHEFDAVLNWEFDRHYESVREKIAGKDFTDLLSLDTFTMGKKLCPQQEYETLTKQHEDERQGESDEESDDSTQEESGDKKKKTDKRTDKDGDQKPGKPDFHAHIPNLLYRDTALQEMLSTRVALYCFFYQIIPPLWENTVAEQVLEGYYLFTAAQNDIFSGKSEEYNNNYNRVIIPNGGASGSIRRTRVVRNWVNGYIFHCPGRGNVKEDVLPISQLGIKGPDFERIFIDYSNQWACVNWESFIYFCKENFPYEELVLARHGQQGQIRRGKLFDVKTNSSIRRCVRNVDGRSFSILHHEEPSVLHGGNPCNLNRFYLAHRYRYCLWKMQYGRMEEDGLLNGFGHRFNFIDFDNEIGSDSEIESDSEGPCLNGYTVYGIKSTQKQRKEAEQKRENRRIQRALVERHKNEMALIEEKGVAAHREVMSEAVREEREAIMVGGKSISQDVSGGKSSVVKKKRSLASGWEAIGHFPGGLYDDRYSKNDAKNDAGKNALKPENTIVGKAEDLAAAKPHITVQKENSTVNKDSTANKNSTTDKKIITTDKTTDKKCPKKGMNKKGNKTSMIFTDSQQKLTRKQRRAAPDRFAGRLEMHRVGEDDENKGQANEGQTNEKEGIIRLQQEQKEGITGNTLFYGENPSSSRYLDLFNPGLNYHSLRLMQGDLGSDHMSDIMSSEEFEFAAYRARAEAPHKNVETEEMHNDDVIPEMGNLLYQDATYSRIAAGNTKKVDRLRTTRKECNVNDLLDAQIIANPPLSANQHQHQFESENQHQCETEFQGDLEQYRDIRIVGQCDPSTSRDQQATVELHAGTKGDTDKSQNALRKQVEDERRAEKRAQVERLVAEHERKKAEEQRFAEEQGFAEQHTQRDFQLYLKGFENGRSESLPTNPQMAATSFGRDPLDDSSELPETESDDFCRSANGGNHVEHQKEPPKKELDYTGDQLDYAADQIDYTERNLFDDRNYEDTTEDKGNYDQKTPADERMPDSSV